MLGTSRSHFLGGFRLSIQPGTCLDTALGSYKPVLSALKKTQEYAKNLAPLVAASPGAGASISNLIYSTVQYGADRGNALEIGGAVSALTTFVGTQGTEMLSGLSRLATNPVVILGTADAGLLWGVGNEAAAAYQGRCQ